MEEKLREEELRQTLTELGFKDEEIHLETSPSGRVGGYIVSQRFDGLSQIERQDWIWEQLRARLPQDKANSIIAILTMTPLEVADDVDEIEDGERLG